MRPASTLDELHALYTPAEILDGLRAHYSLQGVTEIELFERALTEYFGRTPDISCKARTFLARFESSGEVPLEVARCFIAA